MQVGSRTLALIQSSVGTGQELNIPELAVLTLDKVPLPFVTASPLLSQDLRGIEGSAVLVSVINQAASSGPISNLVCTFSRGIYRIKASMMSTVFVGPAASSASMRAAYAYLANPATTFAAAIMMTAIGAAGSVNRDDTEIVLQFLQEGYTLNFSTFIASGVGQTLGAEGRFYVQKLL